MIDLIHFSLGSSGNFLVTIIKWLIQISSSIALGVILFTIILKLITLPFDFISRMSMRKNSLKMEQMRPELEKLQKQYANDKELYNQKMMALYKKNGYSMFGACLPTIITLVIFIVAINAFTSYSQYQNREYFYNMSLSYNSVIYEGIDADGELIKYEDKVFSADHQAIYNVVKNEQDNVPVTHNGYTITKVFNPETRVSSVIVDSSSYISYMFNFTLKDEAVKVDSVYFQVNKDKLDETGFKVNGKKYSEWATSYTDATENEKPTIFLENICSEASAESFREINATFLWVKNIWVTDSPMSHPIESDWEKFKASYSYSEDENAQYGMTADNYKKLISKLETEQSEPNGLFILAVLTAGISFLTQFVMNKSQKAQMELQTVDGQGAQTQKMMMWMMPIMMAFFSFMYTAAFSIYMIISSVFSILTTLLINWIVDCSFKKELAKQDTGKVRGRVHDEEQPIKPEKKKKENKKKEPETKDFINGSADKKVRGRIK